MLHSRDNFILRPSRALPDQWENLRKWGSRGRREPSCPCCRQSRETMAHRGKAAHKSRNGLSLRLRSYRRGEPTRTVLAILWNCQEDVQKTFIEWWAHRILNGLTPGTAFPIDNLGIWTADLLSGRTLYSLFKFRVSLEETGNKNKRAQRDELPHSFAYFHDVLFLSKQVRACHTPGPAITNSQKHSRVLSFST